MAPQRFNHDQGQGPAPGGDRGFDGRRDGHGAGAQVDARNGAGAPRGQAPRWQPGRYPPVYASHDRFHAGAYRAPYGYYSRAWGFGDFLPRAWFGESYWIGDFIDYGLPYPPPGYEWVRVGGDALMIDRYTGRIVQVVRGIFW
ncbi:MAG TPA: RcnB family protein [Phenylobacterium sp.]|nr:RcnB family protein [Phenylobacterium sp.]